MLLGYGLHPAGAGTQNTAKRCAEVGLCGSSLGTVSVARAHGFLVIAGMGFARSASGGIGRERGDLWTQRMRCRLQAVKSEVENTDFILQASLLACACNCVR